MLRPAKLAVSILIIIVGGCAPMPASVPATETSLPPTGTSTPTATQTPTGTSTATPTGTPTITVSPTETPSPTLTIVIPPATLQPTRRPKHTKTPTAGATVEIPPSETPTATATPSPTGTQTATATLACERDTASLQLSASAENLKVGDVVKVTVTLKNEGCVALGLPQYRLYVQSDGSQPIFTPENPQPIVHYLAVNPGQSDAVEFDLTAAASGQATLTAMVSYEVHLGYPGPAYWGAIGTNTPLILSVATGP